MGLDLSHYEERTREAVAHFWRSGEQAVANQALIGTAVDFWTAFREGAFGTSPKPFMGYLMLLQDCPAVHTSVRVEEHHFNVFADFRGSSYTHCVMRNLTRK
jgi:hypothetical protein